MTVRDFSVVIPYLCDAKYAAQWSDIIGHVYDEEIAGNAAYARKRDEKNPDDRFAFIFAFEGDEGAKAQCWRIVRIFVLTHYKREHKEKHWDKRLQHTIEEALAHENEYPRIKAAMTVQAAARSFWNPF